MGSVGGGPMKGVKLMTEDTDVVFFGGNQDTQTNFIQNIQLMQ